MIPDPYIAHAPIPPTNQEEADASYLAMLKSELRTLIVEIRQAKSKTLNGRPLSEALACAETSYLWLCQVNGKGGLLDF